MAVKFNNSYALHPLVLCIAFALVSFSCKPASVPQAEDAEAPPQDTLPSDFIEFYQQFHRDSLYQLAHIVFPVTGKVTGSAGQDSLASWSASDWKLHHPVAPDDFWAIDFAIPAEGIVEEIIYARDGSFWMERRFAKSSSEWFLIYYTGLQQRTQ